MRLSEDMKTAAFARHRVMPVVLSVVLFAATLAVGPARAGVTAFKQAVAEAAASDRDIAAHYRQTDYATIWTGPSAIERARRKALFEALADAPLHGLPADKYDAQGLLAQLRDVQSVRDRGFAEVAMSRVFRDLARDLQTGVLVPQKVVSGIKRQVPDRERADHLQRLARADRPGAFFRALPPQTNEYARLMKAKLRLERQVARGGWGPSVPAGTLKPGQSGRAVVALRDRLMAMGYLSRTAVREYDGAIQEAVQRFQSDHGLETDGVAGASTMAQINKSAESRLKSVIVAMERERWTNRDRGTRHILVNLTDFLARIVDNDRVTFRTRAVVGRNSHDRRSPEFSDVMTHMVINPTWHVPRSIAVNEYLPKMKQNPNAVSHLRLVDSRGRVVRRSSVNFGAYNARNFPFNIKQPPSPRNALGLVKFMFPNRYNIYLHDTPQKHLFARTERDFSHGCIRLQKPFDFAYALLARQEKDPESFFQSVLNTGRETRVDLEQPVPVHIIYRTAFTRAKGRTQFRRDVYGRDAAIWQALSTAGVSLRAVRG